jgi:hypothetical protein
VGAESEDARELIPVPTINSIMKQFRPPPTITTNLPTKVGYFSKIADHAKIQPSNEQWLHCPHYRT